MKSTDIYMIVGFIYVWWVICNLTRKIINGIYVYWWPRKKSDQINFVDKFGSWAVVTGATDGIGKAYARELARQNLNIVLISRTMSKLETTAAEIEKEFQVKTKVIQADFSKGLSIYDHIQRELENVKVGILVNNVGMYYPYPMHLTELSPQMISDIMNVNIGASLFMTRMILPQMQERRKGAIVFVGSIFEMGVNPMDMLYSGSKVFMKMITEALEPVCYKHGITLQRLTPGFIKTKLTSFVPMIERANNILIPEPEIFAKSAVSTLGVARVTTGYWPHSIQYLLVASIPQGMCTAIAQIWRRYHCHKLKKMAEAKVKNNS